MFEVYNPTVFQKWYHIFYDRIRQSLYDRLKLLEQGPLSTLIKEITLKDALYPLLSEPHLDAINRRLATVLRVVELCTGLNGPDQVIVP